MDRRLAASVGVRNPHLDPARFREAERRLRSEDVPLRVRELVAQGERASAEELLLAAGHFEALRANGDLAEVLPASLYAERWFRRLGRTRAQLVRVCAAAARAARALDALMGRSPALTAVRRAAWGVTFGQSLTHALQLEQVVRDHDVLILGETGTGKELVARAIQEGTLGPADGARAPSGAINAAALPETLIESELFGHVKGAFTGANEARPGRLRSAHGGSFFLDEVGDLRPTTQVALLRVMETNEVTPLGSDQPHRVDVRYLAATHVDLAAQVERGAFRQDLYERLAGNEIRLPPLRERPEDIVDIGRAFVERSVPEGSVAVDWERIDEWLARSAEGDHDWPGNVRQLQNNLRDLILGLTPRAEQHPRATSTRPPRSRATSVPEAVEQGVAPLEDLQRWYLEHVLARQGGSLSAAARVLGVDRSTAYRWLKRSAGAG